MSNPETTRISVTNICRSPRGFHDAAGRVKMVAPGQEVTSTVTASTYRRLASRPRVWRVDSLVHGVMAGAEAPKQEGEGSLVETAAAPLSDEVLLGMSGEDFAAYYESALGKKPHHAAKRETLIEHIRANVEG